MCVRCFARGRSRGWGTQQWGFGALGARVGAWGPGPHGHPGPALAFRPIGQAGCWCPSSGGPGELSPCFLGSLSRPSSLRGRLRGPRAWKVPLEKFGNAGHFSPRPKEAWAD